ncbi:MAG: histidine kinase [Anaerolineae bacterium]|jgi:nitrate/nitrite-specific signal transduction histidine kinase/PAS domain-containing protein|nr:GAF domain-containing protein [Chloroflexota bacterium]
MLRWLAPRGLRGQILMWSLVPTILILAAIGYFSVWAYSQVTLALVEDRNSELSRLLAGQISLELGEYVDQLADLRETYVLRSAAARHRAGDAEWALLLSEEEAALRNFDAGVVVLDGQGTVIATSAARAASLGADWSQRSFFTRMQASPAPLLLSTVERLAPDVAPVAGIAIASLDADGTLEYAVVGLISVVAHGSSPFSRNLARMSLRPQSRLTLVDRNGVALYHTNPALVGQSILQEQIVPLALAGEVGAVRLPDMEGVEMIASYAPVPGTDCFILEQESWDELSAVAMRYGRWLILILGLAGVVPALIMWAGLNLVTRPIERLTRAADAISRGEMHQIVTTPSARELQGLATAFNRMAAQLQGLYASLESRVRARTRELSAMNSIAGVVSASLDLHDILEAALDKVLELSAMDAGSAFRLQAEGDYLIPMAQRGRARQDLPELGRVPLAALTSRESLEGGAIALPLSDVPESPQWQRARREGWRQLILVPLVSRDEVLGVLVLLSFTQRRIPHAELALLSAIGNQIGVAVENGRLYQEAGRLAAMAERNRLAQDLHDSVTQTIFTASLLAGVIPLLWEKDPEDARQQLEEVANLTRGALQELRALLLELRPAALAQVPLNELLESLAASTRTNARLPVQVHTQQGLLLPVSVRLALYRIAQEAVNNIVKHANASQAWITLETRAAEALRAQAEGDPAAEVPAVVLTIRDDGQGFEPAEVRERHLGLAIMQERAEDVGATLTLTTAPGAGTLIRVVWAWPPTQEGSAAELEGQPLGAMLAPWLLSAEEGGGDGAQGPTGDEGSTSPPAEVRHAAAGPAPDGPSESNYP